MMMKKKILMALVITLAFTLPHKMLASDSLTYNIIHVGINSAKIDFCYLYQQPDSIYNVCIVYGKNIGLGDTTQTYQLNQDSTWEIELTDLDASSIYFFRVVILGVTQSNMGNFITYPCLLTPGILIWSSLPCQAVLIALESNPFVNFQWSLNGSEILGATSNTYTASVSGIYGLRIWAEDCEVNSSCNVNVLPLPLEHASPNLVCEGEKALVSMSGANTYLWSPPEWFDNPYSATTFLNTDKVGVTGVVSFSGTGFISNCSNTFSTQIEILPKPNVTIDNIDTTCQNDDEIILIGYPTGGTYSGVGVVGNKFYPKKVGMGSHIITYSYSDTNGCQNEAWTVAFVEPIPVVSYWEFQNNNLVIEGSSLKYARVTVNNILLSPAEQSNTEIIFFDVSVANGDLVVVKTGANCFVSFFVNGLGIEEEMKEGIKIYPNPFSEILNVELPSDSYEIKIVDFLGQIVYQNKTRNNLTVTRCSLWGDGVYFLIVNSLNSEKSFTKKILIE